MDSKELKAEAVKPVLANADEEVGEGRLDKAEIDAAEVNTNEEFSYESNRSPFPEGKKGNAHVGQLEQH